MCDVSVPVADWFGVESFTRRIAELAIHQAKKHNVPLKRAADVGMHSKMGSDYIVQERAIPDLALSL